MDDIDPERDGWETVFQYIPQPTESFELDEDVEEINIVFLRDEDQHVRHFMGLTNESHIAEMFCVSPYLLQITLALVGTLNEAMENDGDITLEELSDYHSRLTEILQMIGEENIEKLFQSGGQADESGPIEGST